jgi:alpha-beta hydrolase superfamily lysophospholipase
MAPLSRFASSLKPNVAYLDLNFAALWKKQRTLPSLAYAGIPYHVRGVSSGALALISAWSRSAMVRSDSGISAIFASTSLSAASFFSSWARSRIAARSSALNRFAGFLSAICKHLRASSTRPGA